MTDGERTLGQLVADATHDLTDIVRHEVALAKAEIKADVKQGALGGGLFGVAGFLGLLATIMALIAAANGLVEAGLPPWAAFLIVAGVLLLLAAVLGGLGYLRVKRVGPPERTIRTTKETVAAVRGRT